MTRSPFADAFSIETAEGLYFGRDRFADFAFGVLRLVLPVGNVHCDRHLRVCPAPASLRTDKDLIVGQGGGGEHALAICVGQALVARRHRRRVHQMWMDVQALPVGSGRF